MLLRWFVLAYTALILPIYGQKKGTEPADRKRDATTPTATSTPLSPSIVNVINQEATSQQKDGATDQSKRYFERLISPENLPNIGLFLVGVAGIIVAVSTLRKIRNQAELMERQANIMERQATLMEASRSQLKVGSGG